MKNNKGQKTFEVTMANKFYKRHQITDTKMSKDP